MHESDINVRLDGAELQAGASIDLLYQGAISLTHRALVKPVRRLSIPKA